MPTEVGDQARAAMSQESRSVVIIDPRAACDATSERESTEDSRTANGSLYVRPNGPRMGSGSMKAVMKIKAAQSSWAVEELWVTRLRNGGPDGQVVRITCSRGCARP